MKYESKKERDTAIQAILSIVTALSKNDPNLTKPLAKLDNILAKLKKLDTTVKNA